MRLDSSPAEAVEEARENEGPGADATLHDEPKLAYVAVPRAQHILDPRLLFRDPAEMSEHLFA